MDGWTYSIQRLRFLKWGFIVCNTDGAPIYRRADFWTKKGATARAAWLCRPQQSPVPMPPRPRCLAEPSAARNPAGEKTAVTPAQGPEQPPDAI
jgi:hypothetical protein